LLLQADGYSIPNYIKSDGGYEPLQSGPGSPTQKAGSPSTQQATVKAFAGTDHYAARPESHYSRRLSE